MDIDTQIKHIKKKISFFSMMQYIGPLVMSVAAGLFLNFNQTWPIMDRLILVVGVVVLGIIEIMLFHHILIPQLRKQLEEIESKR